MHDSVKEQHKVDDEVPMFVDMDGTLLKTDSLLESFFAALRQRGPTVVLGAFLALVQGGKARLKQHIANGVSLDVASLPQNEAFIDFLRRERRRGREIWLATAADRSIAEKVVDEVGIFHGVLASDGFSNLKGRRKLEAIKEACNGRPFDYAGDSMADMHIWREARQALVINATRLVRNRAGSLGNVHEVIAPRAFEVAPLVIAMRPYQWVKNALVFIPILTAIDPVIMAKWPSVLSAFICFCLVASGTYLLNDLFDLEADRRHPRKRSRPMASGAVPILQASAASVVLVGGGLLLASAVNKMFLLVALTYLALTLTYSVVIKTYVIGDVVSLAALYTLRFLGGAAAVSTFPSVWLIGFSMFIFFSLALVKRCAELEMLALENRESSSGRDYHVTDVGVLYSLGISFGAVGILVFVLYVADPLVAARFSTPAVLWLIAVCLIYWLARIWIKTARGEMHDDPIVFTLRDRGTRLLLAIACGLFLIAALVDVPQLLV